MLCRHRRCGLDGHEIIVHQFRVAPGGRLARSGLDRMPQLFDVLRGRLSLVGPQAMAVAEAMHYRQTVPAFMVRHKARPGITGWAQVQQQPCAGEGSQGMRERLALDLEYLRHWSLALDLHILQRSVHRLLRQWTRREVSDIPGLGP